MTRVQLSTLLIIMSFFAARTEAANRTELNWRKHYDLAKNVAQKKAHPLVVVLENPKLNSEKIDETKLCEKKRKQLTKDQFELVRVDVNTDYGKRVAAAFGAKQFPYTAVTNDRSTRIVFRKSGQMSEQDWTLALAKSAKTKGNRVVARKVATSEKRYGLSSVQWSKTFESAQSESLSAGKPLFLFLTAPGCTYCDILKREALTRQYVIDELNTFYTSVMVDGRARKDLADRFGVKTFPKIVVMRPTGEIVEAWSGFQTADDFGSHLSAAKAKLQTASK